MSLCTKHGGLAARTTGIRCSTFHPQHDPFCSSQLPTVRGHLTNAEVSQCVCMEYVCDTEYVAVE